MDKNCLPFNACDYRCERCLDTGECLVYEKMRNNSLLLAAEDRITADPARVLESLRESFRETEEKILRKARAFGIDLDAIAGPGPCADGEAMAGSAHDQLYAAAEEFRQETRQFLESIDSGNVGDDAGYFEDIRWHHAVVPVKLFRALSWKTEHVSEIARDGQNSAAVAIKSLTICILSFDHLGSRHPRLSGSCRRLSALGRQLREKVKNRFRMKQGA